MTSRELFYAMTMTVYIQDNDGLIERWKRKDMENILELHNKAPVWNEGLSCSLSVCVALCMRVCMCVYIHLSLIHI